MSLKKYLFFGKNQDLIILIEKEDFLCRQKTTNTTVDCRLHLKNILWLNVAVHSLSPQGVFTLFPRDKPETDMREIAVLRFLCIGCCERSEQLNC